MANLWVSYIFGDYLDTFAGECVALFWLTIICIFLFKYLMEKPWGYKKKHRSAITTFTNNRSERFTLFQEKADTLDEGVRNHILSLSFSNLRRALRDEVHQPIDAVRAYAHKILQVQETNHPLIDVLMEAFDEAEELAATYTGKEKPPFYGIPFSVKGNFFMKGKDCTIGLCKFLGMPKDEECSMVTTLRDLGAIPLCLTNVPQGLMSFSCSNPIYGTTSNPIVGTPQRPYTPGGSSGGEACLVAANGIPFGTGSDLAGSLRIPAAFCGLVTLKPTESRLAATGSHGGMPGKFRLALSFGFFTHTVDELIEILDAYLNSPAHRMRSPTSIPMPFNINSIANESQFRIGYYVTNGFLEPVPAMHYAVWDMVLKLREAGHTVELFNVPDPKLMARLVLRNIMPDGGKYMKELFANDITDPNMTSFLNLLKIPNTIRWLASYAIELKNSEQLAEMCRVRCSSVDDVRDMQEQTDEYVKRFQKQFTDMKLDAIMCPAFPVPPVEQHWPSKLGACAVETALYNMLNMPAGIVPIGTLTAERIQMVLADDEFNVRGNYVKSQMRQASCHDEQIGAPVAVQIVTMPYKEELCLHVMREVERLKDAPSPRDPPPGRTNSSNPPSSNQPSARQGPSPQPDPTEATPLQVPTKDGPSTHSHSSGVSKHESDDNL